jgi:magnesium-transporting ATPase (P-type)
MSGLTARQAAQRLAADGPNAVPAPPPRRLLARVARQLSDPLVALLIVAAVVTTALGDLPDTAVIVLVVTVNTLIGVVQEVRATVRSRRSTSSPRRRHEWFATVLRRWFPLPIWSGGTSV